MCQNFRRLRPQNLAAKPNFSLKFPKIPIFRRLGAEKLVTEQPKSPPPPLGGSPSPNSIPDQNAICITIYKIQRYVSPILKLSIIQTMMTPQKRYCFLQIQFFKTKSYGWQRKLPMPKRPQSWKVGVILQHSSLAQDYPSLEP